VAVTIDKGSALESLSLTPLIDVVFLLLIFFLVATRFAEEEREMEVRLPEASEARPLVSKPRELFVNVDAAGHYSVAGHQLPMAELMPILETAWVNNPGHASVIIRADERCPWKFVVAVMNACQKANIHDWRVTTREAEE
jgi:biopolymer transport protein ExbD